MDNPHSCYCCNQMTNNLDVDSALDELGMLSTVTNSRKQYVSERSRIRTRSESSLYKPGFPGYKVIVQDRKYVTDFSTSPSDFDSTYIDPQSSVVLSGQNNGFDESLSFGCDYRSTEERLEADARLKRLARFRLGRIRRFRRPYDVPWRLYHSFQETVVKYEEEVDSAHSKSNSSSPVKAVHTSLTRSKSLDNLDLAKLRLTDFLETEADGSGSNEVERVSQNLQKLQFND